MAATSKPALSGFARALIQHGHLKEADAIACTTHAGEAATAFILEVANRGLMSCAAMARFAAETFGYPLLDLAAFDAAMFAREAVDRKLLAKHQVAPLAKRQSRITLATADPSNLRALDEIRFQTGLQIELVIVEADKLKRAVEALSESAADTLKELTGEAFDMDLLQRGIVEGQAATGAGHGQAVAHVVGSLGFGQRAEVETCDHPLGQLLQRRRGQQLAQFVLADQDDLQQLALGRLEVGQQAQLLQHVGREVLRLVDDQHAAVSGGVAAQQEDVERVEVVLHRRRARRRIRQGDVKLFADRLQQLADGQLGVEDVGHMAASGNLLQEAAADGGLAGADVAGQQHETATRAARGTV